MTADNERSKPNPEFVTLFVGPESDAKPFRIHLNAIIHYSPFFKNAFTNEQYEEAKTKSMKLENVDEKVFGLFNNWLYTQDIEHSDATDPELMELAKLWTAAGSWAIPSLQNQAMDELTKLVLQEHEPPTQSKDTILQQFLIHVYSTKEDTVLKQLAIHKMIRVLPTVVSPKEWAADFPDGVMADFAEALMKQHISLPKGFENPAFRAQDYMVKEDD